MKYMFDDTVPYTVLKPLYFSGMTYKPGDVFNASVLKVPAAKLRALVQQRYLRIGTAEEAPKKVSPVVEPQQAAQTTELVDVPEETNSEPKSNGFKRKSSRRKS